MKSLEKQIEKTNKKFKKQLLKKGFMSNISSEYPKTPEIFEHIYENICLFIRSLLEKRFNIDEITDVLSNPKYECNRATSSMRWGIRENLSLFRTILNKKKEVHSIILEINELLLKKEIHIFPKNICAVGIYYFCFINNLPGTQSEIAHLCKTSESTVSKYLYQIFPENNFKCHKTTGSS